MAEPLCIPVNEGLVALGIGLAAFAWTVYQHYQHKTYKKIFQEKPK